MKYDIYTFSLQRKEEYSTFVDFVDIDHMKILKHVSTIWPSLEKVVGRTLHQWDALKSYGADAAKIGILHGEMTRLLRKILSKFVLSSEICIHVDITQVPFMDRG
ncbi:hypothetical protein FSP39_001752 [Pinctada imbricata]|uniref:Uncharacterized protein n=1 Tax=Pinctada imbricata TaxID=66713 RepID=A0AA88XHA0_PINIB|nr:hypothetical protein FSP39_001752 [Pinctada imbricata]